MTTHSAKPSPLASASEPIKRRTTMRRVFRLVWSAGRRQVVLLLGLTTLTALFLPASVWISERVVNLAAGATHGHGGSGDWVTWSIALGAAFVAQRLLPAFDHNNQRRLSESVSQQVDELYLAAVSGADQAVLDSPEWRDRMTLATHSLGPRAASLTQGMLQFYGATITALGLLVVLWTLSPILVLSAAILMVVAYPQQRAESKALHRLYDKFVKNERERTYLRFLLSEEIPSKELRAYGLRGHLLDRFHDAGGTWLNAFAAMISRLNRYTSYTGAATAVLAIGSYIYVIDLGVHGKISPGGVAAAIAAFIGLTAELAQLTTGIAGVQDSTVFLADLFSFLSIKPTITAAEPERRISVGKIEFEQVTFTYPGRAKPAVCDLSLNIDEGELLAIVGLNGSGKTTLMKLLLRLYDPDAGAIRIGGADLRHANPVDIREHIGILFQDFMFYDFTVRDNVALGRVAMDHSSTELETALRNAQAWEMVSGLVNGLDSHLGIIWDDGHQLSGGELQRLALARLFLRDADIWILDEPTASLDAEAEAAIFAQMKRLLSGRTGIITSHRFSTVRLADRIAVMSEGSVTELGTHDELIALGGKYAELFKLQAEQYR
jgi:ATP-binding cassette, subfamily B, bacterial